ncbi:MAG: peptidylprolyl isomerase [SAR202 cluster bacterium]|nr:peptidylprolyl isomerase [SAR202 cluster bacterium]
MGCKSSGPEATATPAAKVAKAGDTVVVHYTGKLVDGTVFDSSGDSDPITFTIGEGRVIPGFENGVIGMKAGDAKTLNIPVAEAYGEWSDRLVFEVDRSEIPQDMAPEVGMQLQGDMADGSVGIFTIVKVATSTVTLDANHELAGKDLIFDVRLVSIN